MDNNEKPTTRFDYARAVVTVLEEHLADDPDGCIAARAQGNPHFIAQTYRALLRDPIADVSSGCTPPSSGTASSTTRSRTGSG